MISFGALGQHWRVQCRNERTVVDAAEDFCAAIQLALAELASLDPVLMHSTIHIEVDVFDVTQEPATHVQALPDNTCARWKVYLPIDDLSTPHNSGIETLATLLEILIGSSLLPTDRFVGVLETAWRNGLMHKLVVAATYRTTASYFAHNGHDSDQPAGSIPIGAPSRFPIHEAPELAAPTTLGPGYNRERAEVAIQARYEASESVTRYTLPRALGRPKD